LSPQEEDFTTHTFGLLLQSSTSSKDSKLSKAKPYAAVSLAEDQLLAARKTSHQHAGSSHAMSEDDETTAILARLRFQKALLQVSSSIATFDCTTPSNEVISMPSELDCWLSS